MWQKWKTCDKSGRGKPHPPIWLNITEQCFVCFFKGLVGVFTHKIVPSSNGRSSTSSFLMWVAPFLQLTAWLAKVNLRSVVLFLLVTTRHPGCTGSCQPSQTIGNCSESWVTEHSAQPHFLKEKLIGGSAVVSACQHFFEWKTTRQQPAVCYFPWLSVPHSSQGGNEQHPWWMAVSREPPPLHWHTLLCPIKSGRQSAWSPFSYLPREMAVWLQGHRWPLLLSLTSDS